MKKNEMTSRGHSGRQSYNQYKILNENTKCKRFENERAITLVALVISIVLNCCGAAMV